MPNNVHIVITPSIELGENNMLNIKKRSKTFTYDLEKKWQKIKT